jgi:hypothetical protein
VVADSRRVGSLGELLAALRLERFVGRAAEIELFGAALESAEPSFAVLFAYGPGGVGKSSLLDVFAGLAAEARATVVRFDGRDLSPSPQALLAALRSRASVPEGGLPITSPSRLVLLFDSYERLGAVDDWLRAALLPRLPGDSLVVLAGRDPPTPAWLADPAWHGLLRVLSLRNLSPAESRVYLERCRVPLGWHARLVEVSHGHPLGLSLLAELVLRGGDVPRGPLPPDLVGTLLQRFVDAVPDPGQRRALEVSALARVTTESLLRDALGEEDAHGLFGWLRELSFVEIGRDGLWPHDLVRDALDADLRWRDPDTYCRVFRDVQRHVHTRLRASRGPAQQRAAFDLKFLFRNLPGVLSPIDWESWGQSYPEPARAEDRSEIVGLVTTAEGAASAAIAAHWWACQAEGWFVVRGDDDSVRGVLVVLDLTAASDHDRAADPGVRAAWEHAHRKAPPRPGEAVTMCRFLIDRDAYQGPSPTMNAAPILNLQRYLRTPNLAWDYLALAEPERWDAYFALADLPRAAGADFVVGERRYGLFAHDFRRTPVEALLGLWTERALAQGLTAAPPEPRSEVLVLSQSEFTDAVRRALRDLHRRDLLGRNPLLRTRLLREQCGGEPDAAALADLMRAAAETLGAHPRDDKRLQAVEKTYLSPAGTQEAAARRLGLPFSTYRRHLSEGVERIVSWLWDRELYGPPG